MVEEFQKISMRMESMGDDDLGMVEDDDSNEDDKDDDLDEDDEDDLVEE